MLIDTGFTHTEPGEGYLLWVEGNRRVIFHVVDDTNVRASAGFSDTSSLDELSFP